jgi:hypothetical protein
VHLNSVHLIFFQNDGSTNDLSAAGAYEAPGILKVSGTYYLIVSGKTGWRSNPNKVFTSSSISGPWTGPSNIAPEAEKTYNSQNTFELTITGTKATTYVYMGDSWDSKGGPSSTHIWLPIGVDSGKKVLTLQYHAMWKVDTKTGVVSFPAGGKRYQARNAEVRSSGVKRYQARNAEVRSSGVKRREVIEKGQLLFWDDEGKY